MWVDIDATIAGANSSNRYLHVGIEESKNQSICILRQLKLGPILWRRD
jgi:hypothetical protein